MVDLTKEQKEEMIKNSVIFKKGLYPFEVFNSFWGNEKPTKLEQGCSRIIGSETIEKRAKIHDITPKQYIDKFLNSDSESGSFGGGGNSGLSQKSLSIVDKANDFISQYNMALTVRQIYYRFVGAGLIENSLKSYKSLASVLARGREQDLINMDSIIDRTRQAIKDSSWSSLVSFFNTVKKAYKKSILEDQPTYIEVWVEKDALVGLFESVTNEYDIYLVVGRGYPSLSALHEAAVRLEKHEEKEQHILYFGDFDPSGEDIYRDIKNRLNEFFNITPEFEKVSLTPNDIQQYNLPPAPAKRTDSRTRGFVQRHGDLAVELDALPPDVLIEKVENSIRTRLDMAKLDQQLQQEEKDKEEIQGLINSIQKD